MHTNFKLGIEGEYLGLYSPELPRRVVDEIAPVYSEQRSNISYGRLAKGDWSLVFVALTGKHQRRKNDSRSVVAATVRVPSAASTTRNFACT